MSRGASIQALLRNGRVASEAGQHDEAIRLIGRAVAQDPRSAAAHQILAIALMAGHRWADALDAADRSLALQPHNPRPLRARARCLFSLARHDEALAALDDLITGHAAAMPPEVASETYLLRAQVQLALGRSAAMAADLDRAESLGGDVGRLALLRAAGGHAPAPAQMPTGFVSGLFDAYAPRFSHHLAAVLAYRGPELLIELLAPSIPAADRDVLDLGCGSGLAGPLLRPWARRLDGIDLAPRMVEQARIGGHYDLLDASDATPWLNARPGAYDLILAADVLIYVGELAPLVAAVAHALRPGGAWLASIEPATSTAAYEISAGLRYRHRIDYLLGLAALHGLALARRQSGTLRLEDEQPVVAELLMLRRET